MIRFAIFLGAVAIALFTQVAHAGPPAQLVYSRSTDAESCPEEEALRDAVASRIGYAPFFPVASRKVVASIARRGRLFVATVKLVDEEGFTHGAHELSTTGGCGELLDAVALAIAIAIDPQVLAVPAPSEPAEAEPTEAAAPAPSPAVFPPLSPPSLESDRGAGEEPRPVAKTAIGPVVEASLGVIASNWVAPSASVGFDVGAAIRWGYVSIGVEARVDAPAGEGGVPGGGSVSSWLALGEVVPCGQIGAVFVCGLAQGGSMQASGAGVAGTTSKSMPWWGLGGRAGVLVPVGGVVLLRGHMDVVGDLTRNQLELNGAIAWTTPPVAASLGVDAVVRFR